MDYEKAYKNLVAKVKNAHLYAQTDSTKNVLEDILPELRESEDEKKKKKCIELIKRVIPSGDSHSQESKEILDCIAYLEKQKEKKPAEKQDYSELNDLERAILRGFLVAGVENVPVTIIKETAQDCLAHMRAEWSEEDETRLTNIIIMLEEYLVHHYSKDDIDKSVAWLKSLRPSWKPSEEQMKGLKFFLDFHRPQRNAGTTNWREYDAVESLYEQLKKL